jgi:hypothetical protein
MAFMLAVSAGHLVYMLDDFGGAHRYFTRLWRSRFDLSLKRRDAQPDRGDMSVHRMHHPRMPSVTGRHGSGVLTQVLLHCIEAAPYFGYRRAREISVDGFSRVGFIAQRLCKRSHVLGVCHGEHVMRLLRHTARLHGPVLMRVIPATPGGRFLFVMMVLMLLRLCAGHCKNHQRECYKNARYISFFHE